MRGVANVDVGRIVGRAEDELEESGEVEEGEGEGVLVEGFSDQGVEDWSWESDGEVPSPEEDELESEFEGWLEPWP